MIYTPKKLKVVESMPPLSHNAVKGVPFDPMKSDVNRWIISQPSVVNWLFSYLHSRGLLKFDPVTRLWTGTTPPMPIPKTKPDPIQFEPLPPGRPHTFKLQDFEPYLKPGLRTADAILLACHELGCSQSTFWNYFGILKRKQKANSIQSSLPVTPTSPITQELPQKP